jgi:hypothetical protein
MVVGDHDAHREECRIEGRRPRSDGARPSPEGYPVLLPPGYGMREAPFRVSQVLPSQRS